MAPPSLLKFPPPPIDTAPFNDGKQQIFTLAWQRWFLALVRAFQVAVAPGDAAYLVASANALLPNEVNLGALTTGLLHITVAMGVATVTSALVNLASDVTGNLGVAHLASGSGASASTFWRGDGTWATPPGGSGGTPAGPLSGWTGVNIASHWTATDVGNVIEAIITDSSSVDWRILERAQPATPYQEVFNFDLYGPLANSCLGGVYFYDGTKLMGLEIVMQGSNLSTLRVEKITNVTTDNSTAATASPFPLRLAPSFVQLGGSTVEPCYRGVYLRLGNDGVTLTFDYSPDNVVWTTLFSEAIGTFITPTKIGFGGLNDGSGGKVTIEMKTVTP